MHDEESGVKLMLTVRGAFFDGLVPVGLNLDGALRITSGSIPALD